MAYAGFGRLSVAQLQRHICAVSADTASVFITLHAGSRMRSRRISIHEVFECLRAGAIRRTPEPNLAMETLECRMERYVAGRNCAVIVALDDDNPGLVVVTVMMD